MKTPIGSILRGGLVALACFSASAAYAGLLVEADPDWKEGDYALPALPDEGRLKPFYVSSATPNRFLIDPDSIAAGADGVIRYVLVVEARGGARSVTFEGIRCATGERRLYASAHAGTGWAPLKRSEWEPISDNAYNRPRAALARDYFCDGPAPARDRAEVLRRLQGQIDFTDTHKRGY